MSSNSPKDAADMVLPKTGESQEPTAAQVEQPVTAKLDGPPPKIKVDRKIPRCGFCGMDPLRIHVDDVESVFGEVVLTTRTLVCMKCRACLGVTVSNSPKRRIDLVNPSLDLRKTRTQ